MVVFWLNFASGAGNLATTNDTPPKFLTKATGECPCCVCGSCNGNTGGSDIVYAWDVMLSGFSNGDCDHCAVLNDTFTLDCLYEHDTGSCTWGINPWAGTGTSCGMDLLKLSIVDVGGDKLLTVSALDNDGSGGEANFQHDFGSSFNCCGTSSQGVTYTTGSKADCDWGTPTCTIVRARCCPQP